MNDIRSIVTIYAKEFSFGPKFDGMTLETWPGEAKVIVHSGNQCVHVTISSHVSRPLKGGRMTRQEAADIIADIRRGEREIAEFMWKSSE